MTADPRQLVLLQSANDEGELARDNTPGHWGREFAASRTSRRTGASAATRPPRRSGRPGTGLRVGGRMTLEMLLDRLGACSDSKVWLAEPSHEDHDRRRLFAACPDAGWLCWLAYRLCVDAALQKAASRAGQAKTGCLGRVCSQHHEWPADLVREPPAARTRGFAAAGPLHAITVVTTIIQIPEGGGIDQAAADIK